MGSEEDKQMNIKLTFNIEIDENDFKNLKKNEIRDIAKDAVELNGSIIDYIKGEIVHSLEDEDFNRNK